MNEIIEKENVLIENMIYEIRGKQVMLDSDLAKLYGVETKRINEAVKNNPEKFPERYSWKLSVKETNDILRSKFSTLKIQRGFNIKYGSRVFTEQGIYMLATILKSKVATKVSIRIMDTFVAMRHYISDNLITQKYYNDITIRHDIEIRKIQETLDSFKEEKEVNEIYFDGKIYDAYSKIIDIFSEAKNELIIVDRYTDKTILDMVKDLKCKVILITGSNTRPSKTAIEKYNKTYHNLTIYYNDTYHDRYFIIDNKKIYHSGNSVNHIGYRKSSIDVLDDINIKNTLLNDINKIIK